MCYNEEITKKFYPEVKVNFMNTVLSISISIIVITIALYIFGAIKNLKLLQTIPEAFIIPAAGTIILFLLRDFMPDSTHIVKITIISLTSITISGLFAVIDKSRFAKFLNFLFFTISTFTWIDLYGSTFNIYPVYRITKIIAASIYLVLFIVLFFFIRKQKKIFILFSLISYLPAAFLNFCAIITVQRSRRGYAYILTAGTSILILFIIYQILRNAGKFKFSERIQRIINTILLVSSEILVITSGLLMIK